jgi:hypothetical protein
MMYVLRHKHSRQFRHRRSDDRSYTKDLTIARVYASLTAAMSEAVENEDVLEVEYLMGTLTLKNFTDSFY